MNQLPVLNKIGVSLSLDLGHGCRMAFAHNSSLQQTISSVKGRGTDMCYSTGHGLCMCIWWSTVNS